MGDIFFKATPRSPDRSAVNLSIAQAMSGNEPNVAKWFRKYEQVLHDLRIVSPEQIWSGDESGVQNIPKERNVIAVAKKPCVSTVGAEKGETTSILTFVNGVGLWVPPMIKHKGSRVQVVWLQDCPVGVRVGASSKVPGIWSEIYSILTFSQIT